MKNFLFYSLVIVIFAAWLYGLHLYTGCMEFGLVFLALFCTVITFFIFAAIIGIIWRAQNGVDMLATLETDPKKVKEHMLFIMQYHSTDETLKELNEIFRNYPQWELENWEVFRAWYKAQIDYMIDRPEIFGLTMKGSGEPYIKEQDPLYDPDAPDWSQYDRPYYDDDVDDDDIDDNDSGHNLRKAAEEVFFTGIGLGATGNCLNK